MNATCERSKSSLNGEQKQTLRQVFTILCGVFATCSLVVSNRLALQVFGTGVVPATALTFVHNSCTWFVTRHGVFSASHSTETGPGYVFPSLALLSALSLCASNVVLSASGVSVHQIAKVLAMPIGALFDRVFDGRKKSVTEDALMLAIFCCACVTANDVHVSSVYVYPSICVFIFSHLAAAFTVRHMATVYGISSSVILARVVPYTVFSSGFLLVCSYFLDPYSTWPKMNVEAALNLVLNSCLAVLVQYLSTWTMEHTTLRLYAALGQVKTAVTVMLAVLIFDEQITILTFMAFVGVFAFGLTLVVVENSELGNSRSIKIAVLLTTVGYEILLVLFKFSKND